MNKLKKNTSLNVTKTATTPEPAPEAALGRQILAGIARVSGLRLNDLLEAVSLPLHAMNETAGSLGLSLPEYLGYLATPETAAQIRGAVVSARTAEILRAAQEREARRGTPEPGAKNRPAAAPARRD